MFLLIIINGFVINKVFEYLYNAVGIFQYCLQLNIILMFL